VSRHIVFGTGQIGHLVATTLVELGHDVVAVNRSGRGDIPGRCG
jgi:Trk K+ transport system NAD-binding subunit